MATLKSWVAYDSNEFPIGFITADSKTPISKAAREFPHATRIEMVEGEQRSRLLKVHAGRDPDLPW